MWTFHYQICGLFITKFIWAFGVRASSWFWGLSPQVRRIVRNYTIYRAWCPVCGKYHESEVPGVMPYFAFTNDLVSQVLVDHFRAGIPLGTLARRAGVKKAALKKMAHKVADLLESGVARLVEEITRPVKGGRTSG